MLRTGLQMVCNNCLDSRVKRLMMKRIGFICLLLAVLIGCDSQALYSQLSEKQVNEMVAVLQVAGLPAEKESLGKGNFSVNISSHFFADAVEHLRANGYPREEYDSLGNVFKKEGFVSSPLEEHARLIYALSQEIGDTISSIDGVVMARVHLAVPEQNPLSDTIKSSSASVFIKHRREIDLSGNISQIKSLVVNGIEGLPYENVTVAMFATEPVINSKSKHASQFPIQSTLTQFQIILLGIFTFFAFFIVGIWLWMRQRKLKLTNLAISEAQNNRG